VCTTAIPEVVFFNRSWTLMHANESHESTERCFGFYERLIASISGAAIREHGHFVRHFSFFPGHSLTTTLID